MKRKLNKKNTLLFVAVVFIALSTLIIIQKNNELHKLQDELVLQRTNYDNNLNTLNYRVTTYKGYIDDMNSKEVLGDVNQDTRVSSLDYVLLHSYLLGEIELTDCEFERADVNEDGRVDYSDLEMIKNIVLNNGK